ncbi:MULTISPECIES: DUF4330 domain-containing protein [unclassified Fusibacter]|uniref:DUF4330 domain-containing protein n=1 Tax=unclassified Fusibacter TaxID=2624464 RepID=UPI001011751A|nr:MULTISPECIES: DUF4330 domain-containing protein [unclassified Fusibacter]MCK8060559.1 DUF4330 domain-containing protein [Fusibacter sp. A2]NPE22987.1 DUF4330 domain-containing protein [Fusibacter sp. A1]RXV60052.1 DUF4330 domain-containing protein [Fusibacter sp. A1]
METKKKFNWIDIVILLLILSAVVVVLNRDALFGSEGVVDSISGKKEVVLTAKSPSVPMEVVEAFKIGDKAMTGTSELDASEITEVRWEPSIVFELRDGQLIQTSREGYYDLYVTYKALVNSYASYMELGGQELKVGVNYYIKTAHAEAFGYIVGLEIVN